jgi:hypothetical protein
MAHKSELRKYKYWWTRNLEMDVSFLASAGREEATDAITIARGSTNDGAADEKGLTRMPAFRTGIGTRNVNFPWPWLTLRRWRKQ